MCLTVTGLEQPPAHLSIRFRNELKTGGAFGKPWALKGWGAQKQPLQRWAEGSEKDPPGCGKAGQRPGPTCAINVEGLKRRPPSKVGGLCHEFRVFRFRV